VCVKQIMEGNRKSQRKMKKRTIPKTEKWNHGRPHTNKQLGKITSDSQRGARLGETLGKCLAKKNFGLRSSQKTKGHKNGEQDE